MRGRYPKTVNQGRLKGWDRRMEQWTKKGSGREGRKKGRDGGREREGERGREGEGERGREGEGGREGERGRGGEGEREGEGEEEGERESEKVSKPQACSGQVDET